MLTARDDAPLSDDEWRSFLAEQDFGQLIAAGRDRDVPLIVPAHYVFDGRATIELHLHRDNPVWAAVEENPVAVLAVLDAPAYIPTQWNAAPGSAPEWSAPTSYYAAVHAIGRAYLVDEPAAIAALLRRQMARMQPEGGYGAIEPGPAPFGRLLGGIRGLRLEIIDVRAKFKFGGKRTAHHQGLIADRLAKRREPADQRARAHLLRRRAARGDARTQDGEGAVE